MSPSPSGSHEAAPRRSRASVIGAVLFVVLLAAGAATYATFSISLSPLSARARGISFATAQVEVLIDTAQSNVVAPSDPPHDRALAQLAVSNALYLQNDDVRAEIARAVGLTGSTVAASGPFTLLLNRTNRVQSGPGTVQVLPVDDNYRMLVDVDGANPMLTIFSQAPTEREALAIVDSARALLTKHIDGLQALDPSAAGRVVVRSLGPASGGVVGPHARLQLAGFVFGLTLLVGISLLMAYWRRPRVREARARALARLDPLDADVVDDDAWPHTHRLLPWMVAVFIGMLFLLPFDGISLPISLPIDSTIDRPMLMALVMLWVSSLLVVSGAARPRLRFNAVHFFAFLFFGLSCVGIALNGSELITMGDLTLTIKKLSLLASYIVFFVIVSSIVRPREVPRFAAYIVVLGVIAAVGAIVEFRFKYNPFYELTNLVLPVIRPPDMYNIDSIGRLNVYGPTAQPLELAAMLAMVLPFALLGSFDADKRSHRVLYGLAAALLIAGGLATLKKTSIVAPCVAVLVLIAFRPRLLRKILQMSVVMLVLVHFTSPGALGSTINQLLPGKVDAVLTTTDRTDRYDAVRPDVISHLLFGRGINSYDPHKYRVLDNEYLQVVIGMGLIGTAAYVAIYLAMLIGAVPTIRGPDPRRATLAVAAFASIMVILVCNALFDVLSFPHVPYLLFFLATMLGALRQRSPALATVSQPVRAASRSRAARARPETVRGRAVPAGVDATPR